MADIFRKGINKLDDILEGLDGDVSLPKMITKTVSVRLPVIDLAQIDILAEMKDVSRNVLLNDIIDAALGELLAKLEEKNKDLADQLKAKAETLAERMLKEPEHPHHKGPKKHKKP